MEEKVQGRSYTSNHVKLLKHMDRLQLIQNGERPKPVMFHMSPANPCNLTCSFCCFANRAMKEMLTLEQMKSAIDQFADLGVLGMEFTGGGEPTLHPELDKAIEHAHKRGLKIGICTNGSKLRKVKNWHMISWVRLGMYSWDEKKPYPYHLEVFDGLDIEISAAYVWDGATETSTNPNITGNWNDPKAKKLASNVYKEENKDLKFLTDEEYIVHFNNIGYNQNRKYQNGIYYIYNKYHLGDNIFNMIYFNKILPYLKENNYVGLQGVDRHIDEIFCQCDLVHLMICNKRVNDIIDCVPTEKLHDYIDNEYMESKL